MVLQIATIVIFVVFMISLLCVLTCLVLTAINRKNEIKIKKQMNDFLNNKFDEKIYRIVAFSDYRYKYSSVVDTAFSFKDDLETQLKVYRKEISDISVLNQNYNVFTSLVKLNKIKKDFKAIQKEIDKFNNVIDKLYACSDVRGEPFQKLVDFTRELTVLYETYIINEYSNVRIANLFSRVSKNLAEIQVGRVRHEIADLNNLYRDVLSDLMELSNYIFNMYTYNQVDFYIKSNIKEISNSLFSGNFSLSGIDSRYIEKKLTFLKENSLKIKDAINDLDFEKCEKIIKECNKYIVETKSKMNYSIKYDDYLIKKITPILSHLKDNSEQLAQFSSSIKENFKDNEQVYKLSIKFYESLRENLKNCKVILSKEIKFADSKKIEFVTQCKNELELFQGVSESLLNFLNEYYKSYSKTLRDIFTYKKTIAKMLNKITKNNKDLSEENVFEFRKRLELLEKMEKSLSLNIGLLSNDNFNEELINIKAWIVNTHLAFMKDISYKNIATSILTYSYRYLGYDEKLDLLVFKCETLFENHEYKKVIDTLYPKIKSMKKKIKFDKGENITCQENI